MASLATCDPKAVVLAEKWECQEEEVASISGKGGMAEDTNNIAGGRQLAQPLTTSGRNHK